MGPGQPLQTPGVAVGGLKRAIGAAAEGPRRATLVAEVAGIMPWVVPEEEEVSVPPASGVRRAGAHHRAAQEVSAVVVDRGAVVADAEVAVAAEVDAGNDL